jgi:MoxR-like ATPase
MHQLVQLRGNAHRQRHGEVHQHEPGGEFQATHSAGDLWPELDLANQICSPPRLFRYLRPHWYSHGYVTQIERIQACRVLQNLSFMNTNELTERVKQTGRWIEALQTEIGRVVIGQKYLVDGLLTGLLSNGHVLLEGVPGLAKTLTVRTLAAAIRTGFQRIQFTPDLLPADLIGTLIYNPRSGEFTTKQGPLFSNLILADEINRAPAKVQSALLEAMQERQVTIGESTFPLPDPFLVLATQNPLEQEGTYQLPEAQLDRFMLKLNVGYPTRAEERQILDLMATSAPDLRVDAVVTPDEIIEARKIVNAIYVDDRVKDYIVDIVWATREPAKFKLNLDGMIRYGASPRATIFLTLAARARAFLQGRAYVTPHDVKTIGADVLRHRIIVSYEAEAESVTSEMIIEKIFAGLQVP